MAVRAQGLDTTSTGACGGSASAKQQPGGKHEGHARRPSDSPAMAPLTHGMNAMSTTDESRKAKTAAADADSFLAHQVGYCFTCVSSRVSSRRSPPFNSVLTIHSAACSCILPCGANSATGIHRLRTRKQKPTVHAVNVTALHIWLVRPEITMP